MENPDPPRPGDGGSGDETRPLRLVPGRGLRLQSRVVPVASTWLILLLLVASWVVLQLDSPVRPGWLLFPAGSLEAVGVTASRLLGSHLTLVWLRGVAGPAVVIAPLLILLCWALLDTQQAVRRRQLPREILLYPDRVELRGWDGVAVFRRRPSEEAEEGRPIRELHFPWPDDRPGRLPEPRRGWRPAGGETSREADPGTLEDVVRECEGLALRAPAGTMLRRVMGALGGGFLTLVAILVVLVAGPVPWVPLAASSLAFQRLGPRERAILSAEHPALAPLLLYPEVASGPPAGGLLAYQPTVLRYLGRGGEDPSARLDGALILLGRRQPRVAQAVAGPDPPGWLSLRLALAAGQGRRARRVASRLGAESPVYSALVDSYAGDFEAAEARLEGVAWRPAPPQQLLLQAAVWWRIGGAGRARGMASSPAIRRWIEIVSGSRRPEPRSLLEAYHSVDVLATAAVGWGLLGERERGGEVWSRAEALAHGLGLPGALDFYRQLWMVSRQPRDQRGGMEDGATA